jgi:cobalt-zinc-cadmium efflux system outer membrane protein
MGRTPPRRLPRWPGLAGLALLAGCRVAPLGGPADLPVAFDLAVTQVAAQAAAAEPPPPPAAEPPPRDQPLPERLRLPSELVGSDAQLPRLPTDPAQKAERARILDELFPDLPHLGADTAPTGPRLTLAELQQMGLQHPALRQAAADVEAARGAAVQAGLPPNPSFGFEADTIGSGGTAGQQGPKLEQTIRTAGKLKLAQEAALVDVASAEIALRRAKFDRAQQVRAAYFAVLVAEEILRVARALAQFNDEVYRITVAQLRSGQTAVYEPYQSRAEAVQTRVTLEQARLRHRAAWRALAAAVGRPDLPPGPLAGDAEMPPPPFTYEAVRARMLAVHTELRAAEAGVLRARFGVRLAELTPVPDVALKLVVQKDYTTPPFYTTANVELGVPVPVWDRNQGNIQQARAQLGRALEEAQRVRLDLLGRLADATQRYDATRKLADAYRREVLPDMARAYRGTLLRYQQEPEAVDFDVVLAAQKTFTQALTSYLTALGDQWAAAVELAALAQTEDLYPPGGVAAEERAAPDPPAAPALPAPKALPEPAPMVPVNLLK